MIFPLIVLIAGGILAFEDIIAGRKNASREAVKSAEILAASLRHELEEGQPFVSSQSNRLQDFVKDMKNDNGYDIVVVDLDKRILGDVREADVGKVYAFDKHNEIGMTLKDGIPRRFVVQTGENGKAATWTVVPVRRKDHKTVGAVLLDSSKIFDEERNLILETNATITITVLITVICSIILGGNLSKRVTNQIRSLEKGVRQIARGNPDVEIVYKGRDELSVLAGAFNNMASDLQKSKQELEQQLSELQKSETRFRLATSASHDSIWEIDLRTMTLTWSGNFWTVFGYSASDVETTFDFWKQRIHPDEIDSTMSSFNYAVESGAESWSVEYRLRRGDGSYADVFDRCYIERDDAGNPIRAVGALTDISARKTAERALAEREASFRILFANHPHPMWVYDLRTFRFMEVNGAAIDSYGYSREEFLGMSILDIRPPEDVPRLLEDLARERPDLQHSGEWRHRRKDGTIINVEIDSYLLDFMGRRAALVIAQDITKRKEAEEKLRESEIRFRSLIERSSDITSVIDSDGKILYMSPAVSRIGYSMEEVIGKTAFDLVHPDDVPKLIDALKTIVSEPEILHTFEFRFKSRDGAWLDSESIVLNALDVPEIRGMVVNSRDVTEKKRLESQFLRAQRMESIGTLAGGIAHDLNNILAPILLSLDVIRERNEDAKSQRMLDMLEVSAKRGADLVKQVLSFAHGVEGERTIVQLRHLISEIEKIVLETFPRSISIVTKVPRDLWTVLGDATQLHQVMMNLCVNARDAMPNGGRIEITAENVVLTEQYIRTHLEAKNGPYVVLSFTDNGVGIPQDLLDRIFEPFFTTKEVGKGTGLGLSTVSSIVKSHGGFVNVYSEEGRGTAFKIHLPPAQMSDDLIDKEKESREMYAGNGELILIVDDEAAVREITKATLEAFNYRTLTAADGTEALALYAARKKRIDLVITDMMMPHMDGTATIRALRRLDAEVKVVAVSGLSRSESLIELQGVISFLFKPYTAEKLLRAVHEALTET